LWSSDTPLRSPVLVFLVERVWPLNEFRAPSTVSGDRWPHYSYRNPRLPILEAELVDYATLILVGYQPNFRIQQLTAVVSATVLVVLNMPPFLMF
jgi:hypothetical protein